jgi:hypothetical protein
MHLVICLQFILNRCYFILCIVSHFRSSSQNTNFWLKARVGLDLTFNYFLIVLYILKLLISLNNA